MEQENTPQKDDIQTKILFELSEIKKSFIEYICIGDWLTRKQVKSFLCYGDTAMAELEKSGTLEYSQIGRRKFFRKSAIIDLLEKNKIKQ